MTSSYTSDLIDHDLGVNSTFVNTPQYPSLFGITLSPTLGGIALALAGCLGAGYLYMNYLQPQIVKNEEVQGKLNNTQLEIQKRQNLAQKITAAESDKSKLIAQKQVIIDLFASDKKLETLLLDLNKLVNIRQGELLRFVPDSVGPASIVNDSSLGVALNNKIKRQSVGIDLEGSFDQIQSIFRTVERLDRLLIIKDFRADVDKSGQKIVIDAQGRIVPSAGPTNKLKTSLKLQALIPLSPAELATIPPPPPPAKK